MWTKGGVQFAADAQISTATTDPSACGATAAAGVTDAVNHYDDTADSPSWTVTQQAGAAASTDWYAEGLDGNLAATITTTSGGGTPTVTYQLGDLHGDIVTTTSPDAVGSPDGPLIDTDEYGLVRDQTGQPTTGPRYGWLGAKQRATDGLAGLTLMGVRLYNPATGQFLSPDPVYGGNDNTYTYPVDPINQYDLDGLASRDLGGGGGGGGGASIRFPGRTPGYTEGGVRGARYSGRSYKSLKAAKKAAKKYANKHPNTCEFRGFCKKKNHYHVDTKRNGKIVHTRHYYGPQL